MTPKFWAAHADPILFRDTSAMTNVTIQYNVVIGTLLDKGKGRTDLTELIQGLMAYKILGQFLLTEIGHGLDVVNMETNATLLPDGSFDLHSAGPNAAKWMPSTVPVGYPCVAIVFARLLVKGEDWGVRPFIVQLNDGKQMCKGVQTRLAPPRDDSDPLNHSLTTFTHVRLLSTALLGPLSKPASLREQFLSSIWRVTVGSLVISSDAIPSLRIAAYTVGRYSLRRKVQGSLSAPAPIMQFRTQQAPIVLALAEAYVLDALRQWAIPIFLDDSLDIDVRRAISAVSKVLLLTHHQSLIEVLIARCGAQGVFRYNGLTSAAGLIRGFAIGEGDLLALSIRLATELLLERYQVPQTDNPTSLLAQHEAGLISECRTLLKSMKSHRSPEFNRQLIPQCQPIVEAIGCRMAYDAARARGIPEPFIALFEANAVKSDLAWYIERGLISRERARNMEADALDRAYPLLEEWLDNEENGKHVTAPIISDDTWKAFHDTLPIYSGSANPEITNGMEAASRTTSSKL
ncbi:uncharacterized protein FOMMEDRAFT_19615 [Fomitiporia mediterranea MF3/22]|uniref:uncharacterized protein n=1 Tax=Fomitiporia mediterranea (strain MF3/22) TaxID=694068 RepID=UPI000440883A|nr:uncharacterized protein FOMMEDRAFT_19615 [Fomitiporia mediterranea MF3/22]EJD04373.1 hypothetical protein FOMMEDRAFT_19615 [Fomitiporia mediterranea MF3/22]